MASFQRTWRRAWGRSKPIWQRTAQKTLQTRRRKPNSKKKYDITGIRKKMARQVAASVAVLQLLSGVGINNASAASNISVDGRTATQLETQGNVTNIHTNTFSASGQNAFNSFGYFNVSLGDTVNLHFSNTANTLTATNLLNYVTGGTQSTIDGMLNGIKNGQIGGNVYLLNPSGIMVGSTGVVNVGNLTLSTRSNPLGNVFDPDMSINSILSGKPTGDITIQGKINTVNGITLYGNKISNSGVFQTGAAYTAAAPDFSNVVNTNDLQLGTKLTIQNGTVEITAGDSFSNTGTINVHSTSAGDSVKIAAPTVSLSGNVLTSGASLAVQATDSITVNNDALISTRQVAADSSLAAIKNGTAVGAGKSGNVSLAVNHTTYEDKASIEINKAVIDASGTGAAGTSGDISVIASSQDQLFAWAMTGPDAQVSVKDAVVKGNTISIQAIAKNDATDSPTFDELNDANDAKNNAALDSLKNSQSSTGDTLVSTLGNLRVGVSVSNVHAKAKVTIDDKAKLKADKNVQLSTIASSKVDSMLMSVIGGAGVAFSTAEALTNVNSGAVIEAGGNVDVLAATKNTINLNTKTIPVAAGLTPLNMSVSYGDMKSNASAIVGAGAEILAGTDPAATGALTVKATSIKDMTVAASAATAGGYFSAGVAISNSAVNANAEIAGKVKADTIAVDAKVDTVQNNTWSESSVGDGEPGSGLDLAVDWISNSLGTKIKSGLGLGKPPKSIPPAVGLSGAVAITLSEDNASAKITSTGTTTLSDGSRVINAVKSNGDISVSSDVTEIMKTAAISQQKQREENVVLNNPTDQNKKAAGISAAVIYGKYDNTSEAYIGDNAVVDAVKEISLNSSVNVPFVNNWSDPAKTVQNLSNAFLSSNLGLDRAMFTSWAQSSTDGDVGTASASVSIMDHNNTSKAYIGKGALINQDTAFNNDQSQNDVSVEAKTNITTLNLSGMLKSPLDDIIEAGRGKNDPMLSAFGNTSKGSGLGGSVLVNLEENTTQAYIDAGSKVKAHDLTVEAATEAKNISIGAAGGKADKIGFNGTAVVNKIDNITYAQIIKATDVTAAKDITVKATDNMYNIDAAGGVTESGSVGVGVSIAYNDITRDTQASVSGALTADNELNVEAVNTGGIITVSLAGSVTADKPPQPTQDDKDKDPVEYIQFLFADAPQNPVAKIKEKLAILTTDAQGNTPQAGLSAAGNVSINIADEKALAFIGDTSTTPVDTTVKAKTSIVEAKNDSGIYAVAGAIAVAANADPASKGIAGAFMLNQVNETTQAFANNAKIEITGTAPADQLALQAKNDADIVSIAASGGIAPAGSAIAGQVSLNMIDNTTSAYANNSEIITNNDITVSAEDAATITAVGGALSYGGVAGIGASIAVNIMDNTTEAYISNSRVIGSNTESDVSVAATEESTITAVTAAIGASKGSMAGTFSASGNSLTNTTQAYIAGSKAGQAAVDTKGSVAVAAKDEAEVTSIAGAGALAAGGSGVGFGASASVLATNNKVSAYIGDDTRINAQGLNAGVAVDGKTIAGLALAAKSAEEVLTVAAGGAGGGTAGIAGSASANILNQTSKAYIGKNAEINAINTGAGAAQDVSVVAVNTTNVTGLAGALAIGKTAGIGAGVSTEVITADTEAYIDSGAAVTARNNVIVSAASAEDVTSFAGGLAGGGDAGIAGAANVQVMNTTTQAYIGRVGDTAANGTAVSADGSVVVTAKDDSTLNLIAGTAAYGGSAGIGASVNTNIITKNTAAYIGDHAEVQARGQGAGVAVADGTFAVTYEDYAADDFKAPGISTNGNASLDDHALVKERRAAAKTDIVKGVAVTASSQNTVRTVAIGAGASGSVAATGSASINVVTNNTSAFVGKDASINQHGGDSEQAVLVAAGSDYFTLGVNGAGAVSTGAAGVGAGADVSILKNTTKAYVDDKTKVAAAKDIDVKANSKEEIISMAAALGASGEVGIAGAVGANVITNETKAFIGSQAVAAAQNNLAVHAQDDTNVISIAGGAGIGVGTAGVGGSVSATVIDKDTAAYIGSDAIVDAEAQLADDQLAVYTGKYDSSGNKLKKNISGLSVNAQSSETITDVVASGGAGMYAGVAGSVAVNIDQSKTQAYIGESAKINTTNQGTANAKQGVSVAAVNDIDMLSVSGAAGGGLVGVSGGVDVGIVQNDTAAYLGNNAELNTKKDIALTAMSDKDISSNTVSISGGAVGVAGSVSVYALGTNLSTDAQASLNVKRDESNTQNPNENNVQGYVDGQLTTDKYSNLLQSYDDQNVKAAAASVKQSAQVSKAIQNTTAVPGGTAAFVGTNAKINVGNDLDINASEKLDFTSRIGAAALGGAAVGGAVSVVTVDNNADAHVGRGTEITAGNDVVVNGSLSTNFDAKALAGSAGMSTALAGSGVYIGDSSTATAYMDDVAKLTAANLKLNAESVHNITGRAIGGAAAYMGLALAGAAVVGEIDGSTTAYLGNETDNSNNMISVSGTIDIAADTTAVLDGAVIAPVVGSFAGGAGVVSMKDGSQTKAFIGKNMSIQQADAINISAEATPKISADATVISGGLGALGASIAIAEAQGSSQAYVGEGVQIGQTSGQTIGSLTVEAKQSRLNDAKSAVATARGGAIGGLAAQGIVAQAKVSPQVDAYTGQAAKISTTGKVSVEASADSQGKATSTGINAGGVAVGVSTATAEIMPVITAAIGKGNTVAAGSLSVQAQLVRQTGANSGESEAVAAGGGLLVGVNATVSETRGKAAVTSMVGDDSILTITDAVAVKASADTKQTSQATAIAAGFVAAGANVATASSDNDVQAYMGKNVTVNAGKDAQNNIKKSGLVNITAAGTDNNFAAAKAGVGGVVAGSAAVAETSTKGTTKAYIDQGTRMAAAGLHVTAAHTALFNGTVDSTYASLLGASGTVVTHTVDTDVLVDIGKQSSVTTAGAVTLQAVNTSRKDWLGGAADGDTAAWNVTAAGGGAVSGAAVVNTINITQDTAVTVDSGAAVTTGAANSEGSFLADAVSNTTVHDKARINTGGAIAAAVVDSRIDAKSNTSVTFGEDAGVKSKNGAIKAGTKGSAELDNRVAVDVYGLAGAPAGKAYSNYTGSNKLTVKPNARLTTDTGDIVLAAGQDTSGNAGRIGANAVVNLWNKTVIPITVTPDPQANVTNDSTVDIQAGSAVGSAQDVYLTADKGNISATYTGVGKDLYREALAEVGSAISNLFGGGDVNLDIKGGSRSINGSANVRVDGTVETGVKRNQTMTIGGRYVESSGGYAWVSEITTSDGIKYTVVNKEISQGMTERLQKLYSLKSQYAGDAVACAAYDAEILFLQEKMVAMGLASWDTSNSNKKVFVPGSSAGSGTVSPKDAAASAREFLETEKSVVDPKVITQNSAVATATDVQTLVGKRDAAQNLLNEKSAALTSAFNLLSSADQQLAPAVIAAKYNPADASTLGYKSYAEAYSAVTAATADVNKCKGDLGTNADMAKTAADQAVTDATTLLNQLTTQQAQIDTNLAAVTAALNDTTNPLSDEIPKGPTADFITVGDVTAKRGDIKVKADNLIGSGKLNAPGDASITIINNSPNFLTTSNLGIGDGGSILLNGAVVDSTAKINAFNISKAGANFAEVITKKNTAKPVISIKSTFNPDAHKVKIFTTDSQGNNIDTGMTTAIAPAPDITLAGNIKNLEGTVEIKSEVGSIYANGSINAGTVDIKANNGDFVQRYVDGFNHIGGDPSGIKAGTSQPGGIIANGNVFISARYLNINGLIQSGIAEWKLTLPNTNPKLTATGAELGLSGTADVTNSYGTAVYNSATQMFEFDSSYAKAYSATSEGQAKIPGGTYALVLTGTDNISAGYDVVNDRYVLNGAEVHGGYVQLYGQIMNTAQDGAATGKVRALDGYGTINITNNSGKDIVIHKLDTGSGIAGIIDITDIQDSTGKAIHTRYTSEQGVLKTETTGRWNGSAFEAGYTNTTTTAPGTAGGRVTTTYNPQANLFYSWTTGTDKSQTEFYHYEAKDVFGFEYSNQVVGWLTGIRYGETKMLDNGSYLTTGTRPYSTDLNTYFTNHTQTIANGAVEYAKLREWRKRNWWSFGITGTYYQDYQLTRPLKDITTNTVKASNPVGIEFFGSNSGTVNVTGNNGNVLLQGAVNNQAGTTTMTSTKDIIQDKADALITTKDLNLTAATIGSDANAVRVIVNDTLNAAATNGNATISQVAGNVKLGNVTADKGTLTLTADGNITNAPGGSEVRGLRVELFSTNGTIGGSNAPLEIQTGATTSIDDAEQVKYGLKASALGDIAIENKAWSGGANAEGNLLIDTVTSTTGNVKLTTPGQMIDNNINEQIDTRTWDQLTKYWDSMQLRAGEANNTEKQTQTIASYASGKTSDYQSYWQLKNHIAQGKYTCTDAEKAVLTSQGVNIDVFVKNQTEKYQQLEAQGVGSWNSGTYDNAFAYTVTDAEKAKLLKGSSWTDRELAISLSPGALKELTDTNPVIKAPNVKGKNVTLAAGKGIGSNVSLADIDATITPDKLTPEQKVALAAAERADLALNNVTNVITITQRKPVNIEAGGVLNATAGTYAYLGSEKDILLDQIIAGTDVRLKVGGSILNGDTSNANINGRDVILEAANGTIGAGGTPLKLNNDGTLTARAADDIFLQREGDIKLDTIYSENDVSLDATGNIQTAYDDDKISIMSKSLKLKSKQGVGTNNKSLGISLAADGQLTVEAKDDIHLNNISSKLTVSEATSIAGNIDISASEDMKASEVKAIVGSIKLNAAGDLDADHIETPNVINLISGKNMTADNIQTPGVVTLTAGKNMAASNIKSIVDSVNFTAGGDMTAKNIESTTKDVELVAGGNITVDTVWAAADKAITVKATGDISNGAKDSTAINLTAHNIDLTSETGSIGQTNKHVIMDINGTATAKARKDINLTSSGAFTADKISSQAGSINMTVANGSNLHIIETHVANGMTLRGDNVALDNVVHTGSAMLAMDISGSTKAMADKVVVNVSSDQGVEFNNLTADVATINAKTDRLALHNTITGSRADMTNNYYTVTADNDPQNLFASDVILRPEHTPYNLLLDGKNISTNTTVLNAKGGIMLNGSLNPDSAVTVAETLLHVAKTPDLSQAGQAANSAASGKIMSGSSSLASLVDLSQLSNAQASADGQSNNQVATERNSEDKQAEEQLIEEPVSQ